MENKLEDRKLNIDLADYWMILRKRFILVFLTFAAVVTATIYYTEVVVKPEYGSTVKLKLSLRQPMATIQGAQITWYGGGGNEIPSEIKLIQSKTDILESVIDVLRKGTASGVYTKNQEFFYPEQAGDVDEPASSSQDSRSQDLSVIKALDSPGLSEEEKEYIFNLTPGSLGQKISLSQVAQTNIVEITVSSAYGDVARHAADVLAVVYNIDYWKSKTNQAREARDFISSQLDLERKKLVHTSEELQETAERGVFLGSEDVYKNELTTVRIELDKLRERYQDKHPRIVKLKQLIAKLEADLSKIPVMVTKKQEFTTQKNIQQDFLSTLEELQLKANIDYQAKRTQAQEEIQVISRASGYYKIRPDKRMYITVGVIFGIILGGLVAFVWEGLDTSIGKIEDVERITGMPVIAHIPLIGHQSRWHIARSVRVIWRILMKGVLLFFPFRSKDPPSDLDRKILFNFDPMSMVAEAYRTLRTNVQFAIGTGQSSGNIIAITSTSPREGKTLTSTNLSIALAQMGKTTLLVEADLRRPQIAELFQIKTKPGLSDLLIGTCQQESAIRTITDMLVDGSDWDKLMETQGIDNLNILPCGTIPPNPTELLISPEFRGLLEKLRIRYDFIVVDTPPSLPVSDASIVGSVVDGTVLIYQSDTTSRHLLLRAIQSLRKNNAKLLGIVINQLSFDVTLRSKTGYGYSYSYSSKK